MADNKKVVIITGSNTGIGYETTKILSKAEGKYEIIMACRSEAKAKTAIDAIKKEIPQADLSFSELDLSSLKSIHKFAEDFLATGKPLHILVNNAGFSYNFKGTDIIKSEDGFENTVGTNHLGHFLLTHLLLPKIKETASKEGEARIVVLSSSLHNDEANPRFKLKPTDFDDLNFEEHPENYNGAQAYKNSKLCNVLFTYELARRLEGTGVTVTCLCPGFIPTTDFIRHASGMMKFFMYFIRVFKSSITRTVQEGAGDVAMLATSPDVKGVTGKYFSYGKETESSTESKNEENQKKLWELSEKMVKV